MSLHSQPTYIVSAETANVARAIFPKGNLCITMADHLSSFIDRTDGYPTIASSHADPIST